MLAGIVILLNQNVYFVNVYAGISLNRSFSDTIFLLMWDTKKVKIYRCVSVVPRSRRGPALDTNMYYGRTQKVGDMYNDISFQK